MGDGRPTAKGRRISCIYRSGPFASHAIFSLADRIPRPPS
jgi:hypothetical protein